CPPPCPPTAPRSPYTTLFRSGGAVDQHAPNPKRDCHPNGDVDGRISGGGLHIRRRCLQPNGSKGAIDLVLATGAAKNGASQHQRSEEHTSELQSRENRVCRLL